MSDDNLIKQHWMIFNTRYTLSFTINWREDDDGMNENPQHTVVFILLGNLNI